MQVFQRFSGLFDEYTDHLRHTNGPLLAFWMSYIDMAEMLLHMIRAFREGNWDLHLACVRQMLASMVLFVQCYQLCKIHVSLL